MERCPKTNVAVFSIPNILSINMSGNGNVEMGEYEGEFLQVVLEALRIEYEIIVDKDKMSGILQPNGSWTGLIGMVQRGEADLAFTHIYITEEKFKSVNFSTVYETTAGIFVTFMPEKIKSTFGFLAPFDFGTWIVVLTTFIIMVFLFALFLSKYSLHEILFRIFGNFFRQTTMPSDNLLKYKILLLSWLLFSTVLTISWSATLLSFLVEPRRGTLIRTFKELSKAVQRGSHKAVFFESAMRFLLNSKDEDLKKLGEIVSHNKWLVDTTKQGMGFYVKPRTVQAMPRNLAKLLFGYRDDLFISQDSLHVSSLAFAYGKNFCCSSKLNSIILRSTAAGLYGKLFRDNSLKYFLKTSKNLEVLSTNFSLTISDLLGIFIVLGSGLAISFVILLVEIGNEKLFGNNKS